MMAHVETGHHRNPQSPQPIVDDVQNQFPVAAVGKGAQHQSGQPVESTGLQHLGQHAVNAVGSLPAILDQQDAVAPIRLKRGARQMAKHCQVAAHQASGGFPVPKHKGPRRV